MDEDERGTTTTTGIIFVREPTKCSTAFDKS
jgi:hypothetical protein